MHRGLSPLSLLAFFLPDLLPFRPKIFSSFPPFPSQGLSPPGSFSLFLPKIFSPLSLLAFFPQIFSLSSRRSFPPLALLRSFLPFPPLGLFAPDLLPFLPKIFPPPPQFLAEIIYFPPFPSKAFSHPQFFSLFLPKIFPPLSSLSPFP